MIIQIFFSKVNTNWGLNTFLNALYICFDSPPGNPSAPYGQSIPTATNTNVPMYQLFYIFLCDLLKCMTCLNLFLKFFSIFTNVFSCLSTTGLCLYSMNVLAILYAKRGFPLEKKHTGVYHSIYHRNYVTKRSLQMRPK